MPTPKIEGAVFEVGRCFVEYGVEIHRDLAPILQRRARVAFEPEILVHICGDMITSYWLAGDNVIVVEAIVFSAPGSRGPLTHIEVISAEKRRAFEPLFTRDEFQPALGWPAPRHLRAESDREANIQVLRSMHHSLLRDRELKEAAGARSSCHAFQILRTDEVTSNGSDRVSIQKTTTPTCPQCIQAWNSVR